MTIYGVEDECMIGDYRLQFGFDSDNDISLDQRDVWVAQRRAGHLGFCYARLSGRRRAKRKTAQVLAALQQDGS